MLTTSETLACVPAEKLATLRAALLATLDTITWREDGSEYDETIHGNYASDDGVCSLTAIEADLLDLLDMVIDSLDRRGYVQP